MRPLLLKNGSLIDGTGAPPLGGDVLVAGTGSEARIVAIGTFAPPHDAQQIDCTGLTVAPGFIDLHSHSDLQVLQGRREKLDQGVTWEVVGNCGFSTFPAPQADRAALHDFGNGILCGESNWGWPTARDYLDAVASNARIGVSALVGHGTLRIAHAGNRQGPIGAAQLDGMKSTLGDCLDQGAAGFSTGLMYAPGSSAPTEELLALCGVVADRGKLYSTHMRDYSGKVAAAAIEQIDLAQRTGCKLQISHLQAAGRRFWPCQDAAVAVIERAHDDGIDIAFDCYPYVAGSTVLTQFLPQWVLDGGSVAMLARLADRDTRLRVRAEFIAAVVQEWEDLVVSSVARPENQPLVGKNLVQVGELRGCEPADAAIELVREEAGSVVILEFNQSEENLRALLSHPLSVVISDGFYVKGRPHPRLFGAFAHLLGHVTRERKWMTLPQAIHKITDAPARRLGLARRGRLAVGYAADIVVFDAATVGTRASYENPATRPTGIRLVLRGGEISQTDMEVS